MENFFIEDKFCYDLDCLISHLDLDETDEIEALEEDWSIDVEQGELEPMFILTANKIAEMLFNHNEERYSEEGKEDEKIIKALKDCVDFEKLNSLIPKMYYGGNTVKITKADLLEYIS